MRTALVTALTVTLLAGCAAAGRGPAPRPAPPPVVPAAASSAPAAAVPTETAAEAPAQAPSPAVPVTIARWLSEHLPEGSVLEEASGEPPARVAHVTRDGETLESVASAHIDLTDTYFVMDLARDIAKVNGVKGRTDAPLKLGTRLTIPGLLKEPYKTGDAERLGWPEDGNLRGIYMRGDTAARRMFLPILDRMAERNINLISLDSKDYDGWVTYRSQVPLAREAGVIKTPPIRDLARTIRFIHKRGIRVAMRVSCFEDEAMARARPDLAVRAKWGGPYKNGWLDPSNDAAQGYIIDLVKEAMDAGADEIQLDYVRYPVLGIKNADFHLPERGLTQIKVITDFVKRVHAVTSARKVPLALDIFGVVAHGHRVDIEMLGQEPALLAQEVEVLSPMVYPSHYSKGFMGWDDPGDHPEIVGIGTHAILGQLTAAGLKTHAKIRPWLQAMPWHSPTYSPRYLAAEIKSADENGGHGWMMWNPQQEYSYIWQAVPRAR